MQQEGSPDTDPPQIQVQIPQGLSQIPRSRHGAVGVATSGTSAKQAIAVEDQEEQRKGRVACRLDEDDIMYEHFRQERARMIRESAARLLEVRRQAEERARYED